MIHLLIVVCVISCICDCFNLLLTRISAVLQKFEGNRTQTPSATFNVEGEVSDPMNALTNFAISRLNIFMLLRFAVGIISFVSNLLMPYYLLSMFTKATNASYHRQTYSYTPFMILDLHSSPVSAENDLPVLDAEKVQDASSLTSFNRYIAFMVAKVAMKHIYSTFHAIYNPAGYLEQLLNRDKPAAK